MTTKIIVTERPKLKRPIFIEGLPGVGNVGRVAAGYLIEELKAKKFAELISSHFMPIVIIPQGSTVEMVKIEFFYWKNKKGKNDLIIMIGDSQSVDPEGHYEIVEEIVKFIKSLGVKEIFALAGLNIGVMTEKPKVVGAVNDPSLEEKYKKYGIVFDTSKRVGTIVGAAGLFLGIAKYYGIQATCLMGETSGMPFLPDPKSSEAVLKVLTQILGIEIDTSKLEDEVKKMKELMKKIEATQAQMFQLPAQAKKEEGLTYIG
ncbi:MAG: proteasome assembly chaperone family protein [Candidatus Aenigmarchaeota archaeon]|nr:proteasome assembly chaperone family protein [Candidatus Aenigmarchaeota archaeon]MCX8191028.1 proteasome assembly chaperone family protein [Candidatus Aenigmarchaeota archaeon]MDW8160316.1 proteasome assembly chaperone family protein [Candidatus Aenigmarchaeota archaeon]